MDDTRLRLLAGLVGPCPECNNGILQAVFDGERTNFLCRNCGRCWHPELAWVTRVDPGTCPRCTAKATCLAARDRYGPAVVSTEANVQPPPVALRGSRPASAGAVGPTDG
jgi:hypothetical protein